MDFRSHVQVEELSKKIESLIELMQGHAEHEDKTIHQLLRNKKSQIQAKIETDHLLHQQIFTHLKGKLTDIKSCSDPEERISLGYDFYLAFREFEADHLKHINEEEKTIMPELQRLYTDEELRTGIDFKTYEVMSTDEMLHMLEVLFPTYNLDDKIAFIQDIKDAQHDKFKIIWPKVASKLFSEDEKIEVIKKLSLHV